MGVFTGLIEDLTELVSTLVELVPIEGQQEPCKAEVAEINNDKSLVLLDNVLSELVGDDKILLENLLHKTLTKTIEERKSTMTMAEWKRSKAGEGSQIRQGDNIASDYRGQILDREGKYVVEDSEFGKNVVFHQGHSYGGN